MALTSLLLASCGTPTPKAEVSTAKSKEYFAESVYGVKASPRVTGKRSRLPRGGGRDQLGKPYKVKGKWYYPKEDPKYVKVGTASWYGEAFHGRLTANGEVYDMTHLTAAHPTMPLPSYARVTNVNNGSSVVVRVNDRGPYENGRVIDLSQRAAELLDYTRSGVAKVKVEYLGRAPLHGQDEQFLIASYNRGNVGDPAPVEELATGVMIAMNGPTPSAPAMAASALAVAPAFAGGDLPLPALGPAIPERPAVGYGDVPLLTAALGYAEQRIGGATAAFAVFDRGAVAPSEIVSSWRRQGGAHGADAAQHDGYVAVGTFASRDEAERIMARLSGISRVELAVEPGSQATWFTLSAYPDGRASADVLLKHAWDAGADEAIAVRD